MAKKKRDLKPYGKAVLIMLATYVATFFVFNEWFDLDWSAAVIFPLTFAIFLGFLAWSKKVNISNYVILPVIIADGYFHLTSPLEHLAANSPDWVIAFNLYGGNGMPVIVHQIMGVFLLITSALFIYHLVKKNQNWYYYFYKYAVALVTLTIIAFSYVIKLLK